MLDEQAELQGWDRDGASQCHTPHAVQVTRAKALSVSRCLLPLINAAPRTRSGVSSSAHTDPNPPAPQGRRRPRSGTPGAGGARPQLIHSAQISCGSQISHGHLLPSAQGVARGQTRPERGKPGPGRGAELGAGPPGVRACGQGHLARPEAAGST